MKTPVSPVTNAAVSHRRDPYFDGKCHLYKTAQAVIGCAYFKAGDYVEVEHYWRDEEGTNWFLCRKTGGQQAAYPEHHLNHFCL